MCKLARDNNLVGSLQELFFQMSVSYSLLVPRGHSLWLALLAQILVGLIAVDTLRSPSVCMGTVCVRL